MKGRIAMTTKKKTSTTSKKKLPKSLDIGSLYSYKDKETGKTEYWLCLDIRKPKNDSNEYIYYGFTSTGDSNKDDRVIYVNSEESIEIYYSKDTLASFRDLKQPKFHYNIRDEEDFIFDETFKAIKSFKYYELMERLSEKEANSAPYANVLYKYFQDNKHVCSVVFSYYESPTIIKGHLIFLDNYVECMNFDFDTVCKAFKDGKYKACGYLPYELVSEFKDNCDTNIGRFFRDLWDTYILKFKS